VAVKPLLAVVEIIGIFTKPFSLMIRLFANITAGHIIVLSLVSLVFIFETVWVSPVSVLLTLFISVLELLVAALQAYIFTLLTALYLGAAMQEEHH
jgi:F-type H+-transporting ATPase subunit a